MIRVSSAHQPTPILSLPPEILLLILDLLDLPDKNALNRANQWLYSVINPILYQQNIRYFGSSCMFWAAEYGQLGTLKHALTAGANLDLAAPLIPFPIPSDSDSDDQGDADDNANANANPNASANTNNAQVTAPPGATGYPHQHASRDDDDADDDMLPFCTPLHLAVKHGNADVVAWLLDNGVDIDAASYRLCECRPMKFERNPLRRLNEYPRWRALHTAMCSGERAIAELLIHRGASLNLDATPSHKVTALHHAAAHGMVPIIKLLALENVDLDINQRDRYDNTALHYVAELFSPRDSADIRDTITKLLAFGADLEAHNERGYTPLLNACFRGNFAVAHRLVSIGANAEPHRTVRKFRDVRPLYFCILPRHEFFELDHAPVKHDEFEGNRIALIKALAENGVRVDARYDKRGHRDATALMFACELAEPRAVAAIIQAGANTNAQDRAGRTPFYYATSIRVDHRGEVPQIACTLLQHGARMDLEEEPNCSPLDWAVMQVRWSEDKILYYMLKYATRVNVTKPKLKAALRKCASSGNHKAMKLLMHFTHKYFDITDEDIKDYISLIMGQSDPWNQVETFETILDCGGRRVYTNEMLLFMTIQRRNRDLTMALLNNRFVWVSEPRFQCNQTFLHLAAQWGEGEIVRALLERGADVNVFDAELRTPLTIATTEDHYDVAASLMKEVADPHLQPSDELFKATVKEQNDGNDDEELEDEWRYMKRNYLTAFDIAIRDSRLCILDDMLARFTLPKISHKNIKNNYMHRACQNPNRRILEVILSRKIDEAAGARCLHTILRDIWDKRVVREHSLNHLETAKLLIDRIENLTNPVWALIAEIAYYSGPDPWQYEIRTLLIEELRIGVSQGPNEPHLSIMLLQRGGETE
ncbi:ankyrin repeat-containing domain protein [Podospora fimiseda]|uniref:Ankyrin repeat-containing domain protein n=1 Tax=Podospora fimiseda TaxID=252190 RepID=A0AAN7GUT4_9PEZI|nr:ankyrin repeat-containing domain protein [Podospora fimiseda]